MSPVPGAVLAVAVAPLAMLVLIAGCTTDEILYQTGVPGTALTAEVVPGGEHAGYLDVEVRLAQRTLRFFLTAADPACRTVAAGGTGAESVQSHQSVQYVQLGVLGRLRRGELRCDPVGVLSLREWRDRRPRRPGEPLPRSRATYRVVHRDAELALLRGRFGLAGELGWAGGADTVVVLDRGADCDPLLEQQVASMEYRAAGPTPLVLLGPDGPCPIRGLARPLSPLSN